MGKERREPTQINGVCSVVMTHVLMAEIAPMHRAELDTAAALVVAEEQLTREKRQRLRMAQERDVAHKELRHARSKIQELQTQLDLMLGIDLVDDEEQVVSALRELDDARHRMLTHLVELQSLRRVSEENKGFLCPISLELMRDPCFAADGLSYERAHIDRWLRLLIRQGQTLRSPLTNEVHLSSQSVKLANLS